MIFDFSIDNRVILTSKLDCAIQELDMIFNTVNCDVIGKPEYGCNFEQFLWTLTPSTAALKEYIKEKIGQTYFAKDFNIAVDVTTEMGTERDIYYVTIHFNIPYSDEETMKKSTKVYMLR